MSAVVVADLARYTRPTVGELAFVAEQIVLPTGLPAGRGFPIDPWVERDVLRPIFQRGDQGGPRYTLVYLELPRGHWKSGAGAAVAVTETVLHDSTDCVVAAGDRDQAAIIGDHVDGYLARNPDLRASFSPRTDTYLVPATDSRIRIISSDAPTSWGLGGTRRRFRVIADELTMWARPDLWESLASSTGKVPDAQTIVLSNAGFDPEHSWQWVVREVAEREDWGYLYSAPGVIASWVTPSWVERMRALLPGPAFERVIANRWTAAAGDFVTPEQWARCVDEGWRSQRAGAGGVRYFAGLDLGLTRDRTALAIVHVDSDDAVRLDDLLVWQGTRAEPVEIETIERALVGVARRFRPLRVLADPWQLEGSIQRLARMGVNIREHRFTPGSVGRLSQTLYAAIAGGSLRVFPDRELEREVLGLRVVQNPGGWRVDHRAGGFSDRGVALGMAITAALAGKGRGVALDARALSRFANLNQSLKRPSAFGTGGFGGLTGGSWKRIT